MTTVLKKMLVMVLAGSLLCSFGALAACSSKQPEEQPEVEETNDIRVIGTASDNTFELTIKNNTGSDIVGLAVKKSTATSYLAVSA